MNGMAQILYNKEEDLMKTRKEKITDLSKLKPGDHVCFYKTDFYYAHHGIVCEVRANSLLIIHYFNTLEHARDEIINGSKYKAEIIETEMDVDVNSTTEDVYLHHYDHIPCFSNEETLKRAYSQLGKRGYSLIGNNCEHWARWCRTGEHYSEQLVKFRTSVKEKSAILLIIDPTGLLIKDVAIVKVSACAQFLSALGSSVILTVVESLSALIDIRKKKREREKGSLSDVALKKYVVRRITSATTTVIGGTAGTVVGTILIPVPILGPTVGGVVGVLSGKLLGVVVGIVLSKILERHDKIKPTEMKKTSIQQPLIPDLSNVRTKIRSSVAVTSVWSEEARMATTFESAMDSNSSSASFYSSLDEFANDNTNSTKEVFEGAKQLTSELFVDDESMEYFILTPAQDENAHEQFASSVNVLLLRWPTETIKPWESGSENVLDINNLNINKE